MPEFVKGLTLFEQFFFEIAKPLLETAWPRLKYSAGLLGYGSDVLGFDDEVSTDHMWGPRFYLFLSEADSFLKTDILSLFSRSFPVSYKGYSVNFSDPDPDDGGVRVPRFIPEGPVSPLVFMYTVKGFLREYLGCDDFTALSGFDWLSLSEHRLLGLTSGKLFIDLLDFEKIRAQAVFYPEQVRLYLLASNWSLVAEEQAFVRRCADAGDSTGSSLVCARIAERLMRLGFLYCKQYAPYSKWFGTAFSRLPLPAAISESISAAVHATGSTEREDALVTAQKLFADLHNGTGLTDPVPVAIQTYFNRNIKVIYAQKIAEAIQQKLKGTPFADCPLIGSLSGVANFTAISDPPRYRQTVRRLYDGALND